MAYSAFEQFEITRLLKIDILGKLDLSITNSVVFLVISILFFNFLYNYSGLSKGYLVPSRWQSVIELAYELIYGIVRENIGEKGKKYFPFIFALFMMIVILNLFGLVPYTFSPTAHIAVTFGLSLSIFLGVTLLGMVNYGANYFSMFMPAGSPLALAPFMIIIEIVSHMAKAISLGVRLAANITAGHILFAILSGFVWKMLMAGGILAMGSIFPMLIVILVTIIEMAVAVIQAYVFSLLTSIYISESEDLH